MVARATRSASRGASGSSDDASRCLLLALSHDELGVIFDGLADPLQPVVAVALSGTCLGLRTPLRVALEVLQQRHTWAVALCRKFKMSCAELRSAEELQGLGRLVADDMATLGMILRTNGLPCLREIYLGGNGFHDAAMQALCEGLDRGCAPSLRGLSLTINQFGPAGAEALAAALGRGAMPKLEEMFFGNNPQLGNPGIAVMAPVLRKCPALVTLSCWAAGIDDEGVVSLVDNLGKDEFKKLEELDLDYNEVTDVGCAKLVSAIKARAMPCLRRVHLNTNEMVSEEAYEALRDALAANEAASASPQGVLAHEIPPSSADGE